MQTRFFAVVILFAILVLLLPAGRVPVTAQSQQSTTAALALPAYDWEQVSTAIRSNRVIFSGNVGQFDPSVVHSVAQTCIQPPSGLVSWWPGDGNVNDIIDGNPGTLVNNATFAPGKVGQAFSFDGMSEVKVTSSSNLNVQAFTIDAWVFPTSLDGRIKQILNKEPETGSDPALLIQYEIGVRGVSDPNAGTIPQGNFAFFIGGISGLPDEYALWVNGGGPVPLNVWTHVVLTFDGSSAKTYVNGALTRTVTGLSGNIGASSGPLKIGSRSYAWPEHFNGLIDEVEIYNRALSITEIQAIFNAGSAGKCKPSGPCTGTTGPVDVMLAIDRSGSMRDQPLADEKIAAKRFVDRMNLAQDQVGMVSFSDNATLDRQLTHDGVTVKNAIDALSAGGYTNMSAAIRTSQAELVSSRHNPAARPVMLFMSDGVPEVVDSPFGVLLAVGDAKNAGTRIFAIGLGSVDEALMRQIASSPSAYYYAPTSSDLAAIYQTIAGVIACPQAKVKISPASKRIALSGGTFTVDIVAEDITNLAAYQVELTYNPTIVHVTAVTQGPFLGSTGRTVSPVSPNIDNNAGRVVFGAFTFGTQPGVNGTGVLATITFQPRARGTSPLHLQNVQVADPNSSLLSATTEDGQVELVSCFGDFDGDNDVDIFDLQRAASHWNCRSGDACYDVQFDTEPDGDIDIFDLQRFAAAWGTTCRTAQRLKQAGSTDETMDTAALGLGLIPPSSQVTPGSLFTITVRIQDATNVGAFQTNVVYDPAVVQVAGMTIGPFLSSTGRSMTPVGPTIDNTSGRVTFGAFTFGSQPGASGSGDLAYIVFRAQAAGQTTLNFQQTNVGDTQGNPLFLSSLVGSTVVVGSQPQFRVNLPLIMRRQ